MPDIKSSNIAKSKEKKKKNKKDNESDDPQLQEFLEVMQPRSKSKMWANDTLTAISTEQCKNDGDKQGRVKKDNKVSIQEEVELKGSIETEESHEASKPPTVVHDEVVSDMDYFRSRVKKDWSETESEEDDDIDDEDQQEGSDNYGRNSPSKDNEDLDTQNIAEDIQHDRVKDESAEESDDEEIQGEDMKSSEKEKEEDLDNGRLFVRNLPYTTTYGIFFSFFLYECCCGFHYLSTNSEVF